MELEPNSKRAGVGGPSVFQGLVSPAPRSGPKVALTLTLTFTSASCLRATGSEGLGGASHFPWTELRTHRYTYTRVPVLTAS